VKSAEVSDPAGELVPTTLGPICCSVEGDPDGIPLVCLHGIPGSRRDFRYLAPLLAARYRVFRIDMPGFGGSPVSDVQSLAGWSAVVGAVADALGLARPVICAHSFAGGAALLRAAHAPAEVGGLALIASLGLRRHRAFVLPSGGFGVVGLLLGVPGVRRAVAAAATRIYRLNGLPVPSGDRVGEMRRHVRIIASVRFAELRRAATRVRGPVRMFHAEDDRLVQPAIAKEMAATVSQARLVMFPTGGHHLNKSRAEEIAEDLLASPPVRS